MQEKRDFLTNLAYWAVVAAAVYLGFEYLVPISVPFLLGIPIAWMVVKISRKLHCSHRLLRIGLSVLVYGILGLLITLLIAKGVAGITDIIHWLPQVYELKLLPFVTLCYDWCMQTLEHLDPALVSALEMLAESLISALNTLISSISKYAVNIVSGVATGVPSLILSLLAMIFSTVFVVSDYERISAFAGENIPGNLKKLLVNIRTYLTDTLFVVIRSYALIMLLTFTELSFFFSVFGVEHPILKAFVIALLDILPILGTGGIMIPWFIVSFVLGYTSLGIKLLVTYIIVTVVRNYVEPKIVGTQLGLHPIVTLVAMFIGLRIFGFWGLFGLPVAISYFWKMYAPASASASE